MTAINDHFSMVPMEALLDRELSNAEFRMLAVLYSFRDKSQDIIWPRLEAVRERVGYSKISQVSRMTGQLQDKGWLSKGKKRGPRGSKVYQLTIPERLSVDCGSEIDCSSTVDHSRENHPSYPQKKLRDSQVDCDGQVDRGSQEPASYPQKKLRDSQVDCSSQVDFSRKKNGVNFTATVNSQFHCHGQLPYRTDHIIRPINQQSSEPEGSAGTVITIAKHSRLTRLEKFYDSVDQGESSPTSMLFHLGVKTLGRYRIPEKQARAVIGMYRRDHGAGAVMDALCELVCRQPESDPVGYLAAILKTPSKPMPKDWEPNPGALSRLGALGVPSDVINQARAFFKLWVLERDVTSQDFDGWFIEWCSRDFDDAAGDVGRLSGWYAPAADAEFHEPPGGTLR